VFFELPSAPQLDLHDIEPELILDRRLTKKGNSAVTQVLVKWTSMPAEFATWEDFYVIKSRFSKAPAWGPTGSQGEGNVMYGTRQDYGAQSTRQSPEEKPAQ
jgi:hypothetical protein